MSNDKQKFGIVSDIILVLKREKKLWILPLVILLLIITGIMVLTSGLGPLAPFLYPLF